MEAAIRWAPGPTPDSQRFLLVDVAGNSITLNESRTEQSGDLVSERIARYDKVPNFTAFDWSKSDTSLLALGLSSGDAALLSVDAVKHSITQVQVFPIRMQRKANSIAFNHGRLLALGLDRVRNDHCLTVYDVDRERDPINRFCTGEAVSSVRFWPNQPQEMLAAVGRSTIRLFDVREAPLTGSASTAYTKQVHNIAIDPIDNHYFCSGGSTSDPVVSIWDRRMLGSQASSGSDQTAAMPVLELRPAVDNSQTATVWSIRFSGLKRGRFAVLGSTGAVRMYDLHTHSVEQSSRYNLPANFHGGNPWTGPQYISRTHDIQYPYYDKAHAHDESTRVIAFDWVTEGSAEGQSIMALRLTREVNLLHAPKPCLINMTARDDLAVTREDMVVIEAKKDSEALPEKLADGEALRPRLPPLQQLPLRDHTDPPPADGPPLNAKALEKFREPKPTLQRTEHWLNDSAEDVVPQAKNEFQPVADVLALIDVHKKRCADGYRFDCELNKQIVKEDPKLERLWTNIGHFEQLAANGGMVTESLDMSYFGVQNVWMEKVGESRNRHLPGVSHNSASFEAGLQFLNRKRGRSSNQNLPQKTYNKRLLCLELCGWTWTPDGVRRKAEYLVGRQQFYRAIALAFFDEQKGIALEVLKKLSKTITDNGLSVLLASDKVSEAQKEICAWMEAEANDPYLKAMLRYIAHQDWHSVVNDPTLHLSDRVSLAMKFLKDGDLTNFINKTAAACIKAGDVSGVLLTGLTESCIPLFQNYLTRTGDLQTVVLATAFTSPLYMSNMRLNMWKETYLDLLQAWRCFIERTRFNVEHAKRSVRRDGTKTILPVAPQIGLRCVHCNGSLAKPAEDQGQKAVMKFDSPSTSGSSAPKTAGAQQAAMLADASGTICPRCGRHLPRCAVCLQWLGIPELVTVAPRKSKASTISNGPKFGDESKIAAAAQKAKEMDVALSRFVTFCASCGHGLHAHHARQWFAKHGMCPVPDCGCLCGVRR